jgi:diacylglycerol kinase family enzyme
MTAMIAFIINGHAGRGFDDAWLEQHRDTLEKIAAGGPITVARDGKELQQAIRQALELRCSAVVAGGGDGTLNCVASRLIGTPVAFGVLPFGTLNHFAKDLGIPLDPAEALQVIAAGNISEIDVGEVNGRYFLNNSSIGLYVDLVHDREKQQARLGRGKWPAFAWAFLGALRRYPFMKVNLTFDSQAVTHRTPFVFVGNNPYQTEGLQIGKRESLQSGQLGVYVAERSGRWRLFELGLRALAGRLRQVKDFKEFKVTDLKIATSHSSLRVATDGELTRMTTPLHYKIHARSLRVIVPAPSESPAP